MLAVCLMLYGLSVIWRTTGRLAAGLIGVTCIFGLLITLFGSELWPFSRMQPARFIVPTFAFMAIPIGASCAALIEKVRVPSAPAAMAVTLALSVVAPWLGIPRPLEPRSKPDSIVEYLRTSTLPHERIMIQSHDGHKFDGYESKTFPLLTDREILGSNFPIVYDPPQFLNSMLLGRKVGDWDPQQVGEALRRWGINRVFVTTPQADSLIRAGLGAPFDSVGAHNVYMVEQGPNQFLAGAGYLETGINRINLSELEPDSGLVVIRYRYHPAWKSTPPVPVLRYRVPEDRAGFIALVNPPSSVELEFDAWNMLRASWPETDVVTRTTRPSGATGRLIQ